MAIKNVGKLLKNKNMLANISTSAMIGYGLNAYFTVGEYRDKREEGHGVLASAAYAGGEAIVNEVVGIGTMLTMGALREAPTLAIKGIEGLSRTTRDMNRISRHAPFASNTFNDTQNAYTMRQVGMQMAKNSQYNLQQSMLGNEANYMHI